MSALPALGGLVPATPRLPAILGAAADCCEEFYPGYKWYLVGYPPDGGLIGMVRIPTPPARPAPAPAPAPSLDDLTEVVRGVTAARFPDADWAAVVIHRPGLPDTTIPVCPKG